MGGTEPVTVDESLVNMQGAKILVVEDNEVNQLVAKKLLTHLGFKVTVASNGVEAVTLLEDSPYQIFDVVFMDIQMPVMDGREACRMIRKMEGPISDIPIIALSANDYEEEREQNLACGMNAQINKPIDISEILSVLTDYIKSEDKKSLLSQAAIPAELPHKEIDISGIDTTAGLSRVVGNLSLYEELLATFLSNNREIVDVFYRNFQQEDFRHNEILAHTIKGTSGTLGAMEVYAEAQKLEHSCHHKVFNLQQMKLFEQKLRIVLNGIEQYLTRATTHILKTSEPKSTDKNLLKKMFMQLQQQLHDFDADALATVAAIKREFHFPLINDFLEIEKEINNLDFDQAAKKLEIYAKKILIP